MFKNVIDLKFQVPSEKVDRGYGGESKIYFGKILVFRIEDNGLKIM